MSKHRTTDNPDKILENFGNYFMDYFHDYASKVSLWRYQHRCRIDRIEGYLSKYAQSQMTGLDAGSGKGPSSAIMSKYVKNLYSIEYDESNVDRQKKNLSRFSEELNKKIIVSQGDLTNIALEDNTIDIIVCSEVIEHIDDYQKALAELYRVLKPGGRMIFSMPNKNSAFWLYDKLIYYLVKIVRKIKKKPMDESGYSFWERSRHWSFSSEKIRTINTRAGFQIIEESGISLVVFNEWVYRKLVWNRLFKSLHKIEEGLANRIPRLTGIYFLVLEKP